MKNSKIINYNIAVELVSHIDILVEKQSYYEAVILQSSLVEYLLKLALLKLTPDHSTYKDFYSSEVRLYDLINFWYLLCGDTSLFNKLTKYRKYRNELVHYVLTSSSLKELNLSAKQTYCLGEEIISSFKNSEPFKSMARNFSDKQKITYYRKGSKGKLKINFI